MIKKVKKVFIETKSAQYLYDSYIRQKLYGNNYMLYDWIPHLSDTELNNVVAELHSSECGHVYSVNQTTVKESGNENIEFKLYSEFIQRDNPYSVSRLSRYISEDELKEKIKKVTTELVEISKKIDDKISEINSFKIESEFKKGILDTIYYAIMRDTTIDDKEFLIIEKDNLEKLHLEKLKIKKELEKILDNPEIIKCSSTHYFSEVTVYFYEKDIA